MGDFGKIDWQEQKANPRSGDRDIDYLDIDIPAKRKSLEELASLYPSKSAQDILLVSCTNFENEKKELAHAKVKFCRNVAEVPFLSIFIVWAKQEAWEVATYLGAAELIIKEALIPTHIADGNTLSLEIAQRMNHAKVLEAIRCLQHIDLRHRENMVDTYLNFFSWLNHEHPYSCMFLEDPDRRRAQFRELSFYDFRQFLFALPNVAYRLVAKLLYFGGDRVLDEILGLELENVNYEKNQITFDQAVVSYPPHVFSDIKIISDTRTTGRMFLGRQNSPLSSRTIFRNFQEAAKQAKIAYNTQFSIKHLTNDTIRRKIYKNAS